jgi:hypothetical protein
VATLSYEVGAIFSIVDEATPALTRIGEAFSRLAEQADTLNKTFSTIGERAFSGMQARLTEASDGMSRLIRQADELAGAFSRADAASRGMAPGAGGGGRGGGGPRARDEALATYDGINEDRRNANWMNANQNQIYNRDYAAANRVNDNMDWQQSQRNDYGLYGPAPRPYWGEGDEFANANAENRQMDVAEANRQRQRKYDEAERDASIRNRNAMIGGAAGGVLHGAGPFVGAALGYGAFKGSMTEDLALQQSLTEMGYDPKDPNFAALKDQLREQVSAGTQGTIYSESKGANALPGLTGQFSAVFGSPEERREKFESMLPTGLRFAEVAEQYHRGSLQSSLGAGIGYAHMTHRYGGPELDEGLNHLLALSLATGDTVAGELGVLRYSVPLGEAAGIDADKIAALTGFFQVMGFTGTTAGTGVGQMLTGLSQTGGPISANLASSRTRDLEHTFEKTFNLEPSRLHEVRQKGGTAHVEAMKELGLYDAAGKVEERVAPGGRVDSDEMMRRIAAALQRHTPIEDLKILRDAFTVRGSREAALFTDPTLVPKLLTFLENMAHPPSAVSMQQAIAGTPLQQFEQMLANFANIGNTLATQTLPGLNDALKVMNTYLISFNTFLKEHPTAAAVGGWGAAGLITATALGAGATAVGKLMAGPRAIWNWGRGLAGGEGGAAAAGGEAAVTGGGLGAGLMGLSRFLPVAALVDQVLSYAGTETGSAKIESMVFNRRAGPRADAAPTTTAPASVTNNFTLNLSGMIDEAMKSNIVTWVTGHLSTAITHASTEGQGTMSSPYTTPGAIGF